MNTPVEPHTSFTVYPAIDVRGGRVVRLHRGNYAKETRYSDDPVEVAGGYALGGAQWLHLVDLDAARAGGYTLGDLLARISTETGLRVQTGGGVRQEADVEALLAGGAERVVVGSLAVRDPELVIGWIERFGADHITVALDTRTAADGTWVLPVAGWTEVEGGADLTTMLHQYADAGLHHLLCTDISRDGTLAGPNINLYTMLTHSAPSLAIQASGGARDAGDVRSARRTGCAGMILGKALLEGRLTIEQAVAEESR